MKEEPKPGLSKQQAENRTPYHSNGGGTTSADRTEATPSPIPSISLPKGGGAIRGMGEKFAANPVTGTGSMTVPIAVSPGRGGFGPQLSLSYDSGAGNGPFGLGWNLSLPAITRKTDKGLPQYNDAEESDVFILSGAEDLVPVLNGNSADPSGEYQIKRYRPRIEGLFARIERWTSVSDGNTHWRSISKDNLLTIYGQDENSRIANPLDKSRVYSWLICETRDDKGNGIVYEYIADNAVNVDVALANERNRGFYRNTNRYLKRIKYGNKTTLLDGDSKRPPFLTNDQRNNTQWLFDVVFDYGDEPYRRVSPERQEPALVQAAISTSPGQSWPVRTDPFSSYRSGFEVRTYRLCQRVLMFHHFDELRVADYLVRSTEFDYEPTPIASYLNKVTQSGYVRQPDNTYLKRSLPPVEFEYSQANIQDEVRPFVADSLDNLPIGLDGSIYQWIDLDGDGVGGILTEQGDAWFYKRNLSPLTMRREVRPENGKERVVFDARFAPLETVAVQPSFKGITGGGMQFLDLAGNGRPDLAQFDGAAPGFFEHTEDNVWETHRPFKSLPNVNWRDPNLKFIDLTGDGHADILISEDEVFTWHPSLAEDGFGPSERVRYPFDEEKGPRIVFADATQSISLADFSGDGLTGIVRIRNGEICYWPNLGYGRFGAKVTMDNSPWFDHPDQFDQRRIRLADIDGSGVTDIIYLHGEGVRIYFNESGNSWSDARTLGVFPATDNLSAVTVTDLFGNGTACLVWSSPLPGHAQRPMYYVDLMDGQKPHLMIKSKNNLGAETSVDYAPSTKFYLQDKYAGKPWITRLPFPVHVVEKVTVTDKWRKTAFSSTYSYHHGYFDGIEREFRGFGRVEQIDIEDYGTFADGNTDSPFITDDKKLYQPPIKTVTWFHTGAFFDRERILNQFEKEYFSKRLEEIADARPDENIFRENHLPEPDLYEQDLTADEWREALRACKGMTLRQEIYELDVDEVHNPPQGIDALHDHWQPRPVKLFSTAYHNCHIRKLQPKAENKFAVFLVTESEAITYNYELDLQQDSLTPDPRIAHTLNLSIDEYGNVQQAVAVVYPRLAEYTDSSLPDGTVPLINRVQQELHLAYSETRYTNDVIESNAYRLRVPCEVLTYELTGIKPQGQSDRLSADLIDDRYFTLDELRAFHLSETSGETIRPLEYHQVPNRSTPEKRLVEHARSLFFKQDLSGAEEFRKLNALGLPYENYKLALTQDLLTAVFDDQKLADIGDSLTNSSFSGYLGGEPMLARFGDADTNAGQYWIRSGIAGFAPDAAEHFYLPERFTDPFGNATELEYDARDLYIKSSKDALENQTEVTKFDYRVLAPAEMRDINDNYSEVAFDILGMPAAMAVKGKGTQADNLTNLSDDILNPDPAAVQPFFTGAYDEAQAREWLGNATVRYIYSFGEVSNSEEVHPPCACGILREKHVAMLQRGESSKLQVAFEYSDGAGNALMKKAQAEPESADGPLRWIVSGKTILNNKGKPVKQYEPAFTDNHRFEPDPDAVGVTPVMYYDAPGRLIRTEMPDGSYSRVEFSPWHVTSFDQNDTVLEPGNAWYARKSASTATTEEQRAARLAARHAGTHATVFLDSLGREVISVAHNRSYVRTTSILPDDPRSEWVDEKYVTFTKLDAEGKPLWIRDARGNLVMQYIFPYVANNQSADPVSGFAPCYDIAGNLLFQHSMDAGDRWMLNDAAGKPMYAWDFNERQDSVSGAQPVGENRILLTDYDGLHRPTNLWLSINGQPRNLIQHFIYGEAQGTEHNLRGQIYQHYDQSGLQTFEKYDFKGLVCEVKRELASQYKAQVIDWRPGSPTAELGEEEWTQITEYDALSRMRRLFNWHLGMGSRVAVYLPDYNEGGVLRSERIVVHARKTDDEAGYEPFVDTNGTETRTVNAIEGITYDAKGQRTSIEYGNRTLTRYDYDPKTFRLKQLRTTRPGYNPRFPEHHSNLRDDRVLQQLNYTYDPTGNITEIYDEAYKPVYFLNREVESRSRYVYDALYRLIAASGRENANIIGEPGPREAPVPQVSFPITDDTLRRYDEYYLYDQVGNFVEMIHSANGGSWHRYYRTAEDSNRLTDTWHGAPNIDDGTNRVHYNYDTHGSMLNLANTAELQNIRWDFRDMIQALDGIGGGWTFYNYDSEKQRTRKVNETQNGTKQWERIYLGGLEIYRQYSGTDVVEEIETLHLFADDKRVLLVEDVIESNTANLGTGILYRYQYSNHLGSVGLEMNADGNVISYEEYHPYGTTAYQANGMDVRALAKRYRYTGMERDEETGLNYHTARYYASWLGRWVGCDPIGLEGGINLFLYTNASPVCLIDNNGKQYSEPRDAGVVAGAPQAPETSPPPPPPPPPVEAIVVLFSGANLTVDSGTGVDEAHDETSTTRRIGVRIAEAVGTDRVRLHIVATPVGHEYELQAAEQFVRNQLRLHPGARVIIYGHSRGGHTALDLSRRLATSENPVEVDLLFTTDAAFSHWSDDQDQSVPGNVGSHLNWYQDNPRDPSYGSHGAPHYPVEEGTNVYNYRTRVQHEQVDEYAQDEVVRLAVGFIESGGRGRDWVPNLSPPWSRGRTRDHRRRMEEGASRTMGIPRATVLRHSREARTLR